MAPPRAGSAGKSTRKYMNSFFVIVSFCLTTVVSTFSALVRPAGLIGVGDLLSDGHPAIASVPVRTARLCSSLSFIVTLRFKKDMSPGERVALGSMGRLCALLEDQNAAQPSSMPHPLGQKDISCVLESVPLS